MRFFGTLFLAVLIPPITIVSMASADVTNATSTDSGKTEFTSANYWIKIDLIEDHSIGDVFFINGTTNLPVTENLTMGITGVIRPHQKQIYPIEDSRYVVINNIPIFSIVTTPPVK